MLISDLSRLLDNAHRQCGDCVTLCGNADIAGIALRTTADGKQQIIILTKPRTDRPASGTVPLVLPKPPVPPTNGVD